MGQQHKISQDIYLYIYDEKVLYMKEFILKTREMKRHQCTGNVYERTIDAIFYLPTPLVLSKVVDALDEIYAMMNEIQTADVRGDVYEYLLSKIAQSGLNGQFRTLRHIEMMNPCRFCRSSRQIKSCGTKKLWMKHNYYLIA